MSKSFQTVLIGLFSFVLLHSCSDDEISYPDFIKEGAYTGAYFPTTQWRECSPEEVGMNPDKLKSVYDYCAAENRNTYSFIIIKDGYIVAEHYFGDYNETTLIQSYSLAKSFTAALTGIAIQQNYLNSVDDKIADYLPELQSENVQPEKKQVSIKHCLTMTSGFEWYEDAISLTNNDLLNLRSSDNYIDYILRKPIVENPGEVWNYSSGLPLLLGRVIENTTGMLLLDYANQTLFNNLGINTVKWDSGPQGYTIGAWGLNLSSRDYAKLGYLYWENGVWEGKQILPEYWVADTRKPALENAQHYGYLFWRAYRYADAVGTKVPEDTYMATGLFQKYIIIIPSYNLVIVRLGEDWIEGTNGWDTAEFISRIILAVDNP